MIHRDRPALLVGFAQNGSGLRQGPGARHRVDLGHDELMGGPGRFGAVATAMVTPFGDDGELNGDAAIETARWLADNGSDALVVAGSTGESTVLSDSEKVQLWKAVADAVTVPVIAGTGTADTGHSIGLTRAAEKAGVAAVLAVTPYYSRPPQSGIGAHFRAIAAATSLPVLLYDIPVRTGRKIGNDTILGLAGEVSNVVGLKDAAGQMFGSARLIAEAPAGFEVYSGDDSLTLPMLAVGAVGVVGVATHWSGAEHQDMISAFFKGDLETARETNAALLESFAFESFDEAPNPMPAKAMMRVLGLPAGQCRPPIGPAPEFLDHQARAVLAKLRRARRESSSGRGSTGPAGG